MFKICSKCRSSLPLDPTHQYILGVTMKYKKIQARLEARQKKFDEMPVGDRARYHHMHRPGSFKK